MPCRLLRGFGAAKKMMKLYMDVSTNIMYLALAKDQQLIDVSVRHANKDHAKYLVDRIDQLLKKNGVTLEDIHEIVVGEGPGSYTGIRIAVTVGKTLSYAKNIPLYAVSSLIFMSSGLTGLVCVMHDARRGYAFATIYQGHEVFMQSQYILQDTLKKHPHYEDAHLILLDHEHYRVDTNIIDMHKRRIEDVHAFEPNYTRKTEAEEHAS